MTKLQFTSVLGVLVWGACGSSDSNLPNYTYEGGAIRSLNFEQCKQDADDCEFNTLSFECNGTAEYSWYGVSGTTDYMVQEGTISFPNSQDLGGLQFYIAGDGNVFGPLLPTDTDLQREEQAELWGSVGQEPCGGY